MRSHALYWVVAPFNFRNYPVQFIAVKVSAVSDLAAGLGIKGRVIQDDLAFLSGLEFLNALAILDDGQHFAIFRTSLEVAFEDRLWKLLIRGIRGLLGRAFPGSAGTRPLFLHRRVKTGLVEGDATITRCILHEIQRHSKRVIKLESLLPAELAGIKQ